MWKNIFIFGFLHPVALTLSRLLDEQSLATTLQGVYFIFYIFAATFFGPCWPSSGGIHNYSNKLPHSQRINKHPGELLGGTVLLVTLMEGHVWKL
jgi:hypothetical protein